jgi:hypothetical protein
MAGDWIKVEKATVEKPEVLAISEMLGIHPVYAFGLCVKFWMWCDDQLSNGNAKSVTKVTLDYVIGHDGMTDALIKVDWLRDRSGSFEVPHFDRHLSEGAKNRALTKERVRKSKAKSNDASVNKVTQTALPEKRREEKITTTPIGKSTMQKQSRQPEGVVGDGEIIDLTQTSKSIFDDLQSRINALHPMWKKRPSWSYRESSALFNDSKSWSGLSDEDWQLLADYMDAEIPVDWKTDPRDFPQPDTRSGLITIGVTTMMNYAERFDRKRKTMKNQ